MHEKIDIGLRIREYLEKKKYSQSEVAELIGRSRQAVHSALLKKDVKVHMLLQILKSTGGTLENILPEFCTAKEDDDELKKYMQELIKVQRYQIERLKEELKS